MPEEIPATPHRRRPRYSGKNPRRFEEKYKEHAPEKYPETIAKVLASGKTPAGSHVPILLDKILEILNPKPGEVVVDCTLGYGGHASEILKRLQPGGRLIGLDVDPVEQPRTESRLREMGFGPDLLTIKRSNFAGLARAIAAENLSGVDCVLADLGVSSMQLDNPERGFSMKVAGPLDMRMNPNKGRSAAALLASLSKAQLATILTENSDEPHAELLAAELAGRTFQRTTELATAIRTALRQFSEEEREKSVRLVFQALRIEVNEEFSALEMLLRDLPSCLNPGGRAAILTFHSGEDRRVKKSFQALHRAGMYSEVATDVIRASPEECRNNPRASPAKLRWAIH